MIPEYLSRHARENVWCVPYQDNQVIVDLAHISPPMGEIGSCNVMWSELWLPTPQDYYHVYQIGGNSPDRLGLPWKTAKWQRLSEWATENNAIIDLYNENGLHLPLSHAYVYRLTNGNFVVAIQLLSATWAPDYVKNVKVGQEKVYLRIYCNEFYNSQGGTGLKRPVVYGGGLMRTNADITKFRQEINSLLLRDGLTKLFLDGCWVDVNHLSSIVVGNVAEYVYDASVERVIDFDVGQLREYTSLIDDCAKYLLHPPKDARGLLLRYRDDVDVYLYVGDTDLTSKGLYYHRNAEDSLRMVTHADYGLRVDYVNAYQPRLSDKNVDLRVQLHIRNAGDRNYLVNEEHRIARLYQYDDEFIENAMVGGDAVMPYWQAARLECSLYPAIMRDYVGNPDPNDVAYCYGPNAAGLLLANSPVVVKTDQNGKYAEVGLQLTLGCTAMEYDADGVLLGTRYHIGGERYHPTNVKCAMVEFHTGVGGHGGDWTVGTEDVVIPDGVRYQLYVCPLDKGKVTEEWVAAKPDVDYRIDNGKVVWLVNVAAKTGLFVTDAKFLLSPRYDYSYPPSNRITITHDAMGADFQPLTLQPERLAICYNGHWLIENFNCVVKWPQVYVTTDRYMRHDGQPQEIIIMATGFCDPKTMERTVPEDVGYVYNGVVSADNRFNLRDDRVMRVMVDGKLVMTDAVPWAETCIDGDTTGYAQLANGMPYMAYPAVIPLREYSESVNASLDTLSKLVDSAVTDYLSQRVPMYTPSGPNPIQDFYELYSPFFAAVVGGLKEGTVYPPYKPDDKQSVRDAVVNQLVHLDFDPCRLDVNPNYVRIKPYPLAKNYNTVTKNVYRFLESINQSYLNGRLDLEMHFRIGDTNGYEDIPS